MGVSGVPTMYTSFLAKWATTTYPLYHSMYEVAWTLERYIDPGYKAITSLTRVWCEMARNLADTVGESHFSPTPLVLC